VLPACSPMPLAGSPISARMALVDRALALNPSYARGWFISGLLRLLAGNPDRAIEDAKISLRLSPRARVGQPFNLTGAAHLVGQRFEEALPNLLFAVQEDPTFPEPYRHLAVCYVHMGRFDEACKRRSKNPSLKRPVSPVAPE
jgi:tetratricopeptide (TPR) repeat protein